MKQQILNINSLTKLQKKLFLMGLADAVIMKNTKNSSKENYDFGIPKVTNERIENSLVS